MDRLRRRDADGRMVREPCRDPAKAGRDPPPRRRVGHEEASASVSSFGGGSRRRARHGLHHGMALRVAFPSHKNGRTPFAARSPLDRPWGRALGDRPAVARRGLDKRSNAGDAGPRTSQRSFQLFFLSHRMPAWFASPFACFSRSRRARARSVVFAYKNNAL
jgi:hypothetical protein